MAKGFYVQEGSSLDYTNTTGADIGYCDVVVFSGRIGVAEADIPNGALGAVSVAGVYELPAASAATFSMGQALYWDATGKTVTATADSNTPCGFAAAPKVAATVTAMVKIG